MKIVIDGNYCVKCHSVGDFQATARSRRSGRIWSEVYRRMRPEYRAEVDRQPDADSAVHGHAGEHSVRSPRSRIWAA